jgi:hypothetical protein
MSFPITDGVGCNYPEMNDLRQRAAKLVSELFDNDPPPGGANPVFQRGEDGQAHIPGGRVARTSFQGVRRVQTGFQRDMSQADKVVHNVEDEWHHPIMTRYGYVPIDKEGIGLVRAFRYAHPETKHEITVNTGVNADYWSDPQNRSVTGKNYWSDLEPHMKSITQSAV